MGYLAAQFWRQAHSVVVERAYVFAARQSNSFVVPNRCPASVWRIPQSSSRQTVRTSHCRGRMIVDDDPLQVWM